MTGIVRAGSRDRARSTQIGIACELRRNIVIDAETAQLVAAAVQAALQTGTPSR